jgi:hypothetical protein
VVALTLPDGVIRGLRDVHPDLAWAVVTLFERGRPSAPRPSPANAELVSIADRHYLIVVKRKALTSVPGVQVVPLDDERAFLALDAGRGIADLELAVLDRLADIKAGSPEYQTLSTVRDQLRKWRRSRAFRFHSHSIIVVEELQGTRLRPSKPR